LAALGASVGSATEAAYLTLDKPRREEAPHRVEDLLITTHVEKNGGPPLEAR
jgi:hypothetical protein